jgi:hypothetical protein
MAGKKRRTAVVPKESKCSTRHTCEAAKVSQGKTFKRSSHSSVGYGQPGGEALQLNSKYWTQRQLRFGDPPGKPGNGNEDTGHAEAGSPKRWSGGEGRKPPYLHLGMSGSAYGAPRPAYHTQGLGW